MVLTRWCEGFVEEGVEEVARGGLGGGELGFEAVAEGHKLFDFGDDAVLFGEGWNWDFECLDQAKVQVSLRCTFSIGSDFRAVAPFRTVQPKYQVIRGQMLRGDFD